MSTNEPIFTMDCGTSSGLVLNCSLCGTVAEYPAPNGAPGDAESLSEINDDALMHTLEHS